MAVSKHRHYVSCDEDDLERTEGALLITSKVTEDEQTKWMCIGAAAAIRVIGCYDTKDEEDFKKCWSLVVKEMK